MKHSKLPYILEEHKSMVVGTTVPEPMNQCENASSPQSAWQFSTFHYRFDRRLYRKLENISGEMSMHIPKLGPQCEELLLQNQIACLKASRITALQYRNLCKLQLRQALQMADHGSTLSWMRAIERDDDPVHLGRLASPAVLILERYLQRLNPTLNERRNRQLGDFTFGLP